jgi:AcrR family transcriptional regulator
MVRQLRAVATRETILLAAADTFDTFGYEGARLSEIVDRACTTKGALYFHFQSKEELAEMLVGLQRQATSDAMAAIAQAPASPLEKLVMTTHELARQVMEDRIVRAGIRLALEANPRTDAALRALAEEYSAETGSRLRFSPPLDDWVEQFRLLLGQGVAAGEVRAEIDIDVAAQLLVGAYVGVQLLSNLRTERKDLHERLHDMWRVLLVGIVDPGHGHRREDILDARWRPASG